MIRLLLPFAALALSATQAAAAAERTYSVYSFDKLRVDGPFRVILAVARSPGAKAEGDPRVTDLLDVHIEGTTLVVRAGVNGWGEQPAARSPGAPVIRLSTPVLRSVAMIGGGDVTIAGPIKGQRIDLTLTGSGTLSAAAIDADQLAATVIGSGSMTLAGRAAKARLSTNGPARMRAAALSASDLVVHTDGNGEMEAQARYTANLITAGVGSVTVYGSPACTMKANPDGPVSCGKLAMPPAPAP